MLLCLTAIDEYQGERRFSCNLKEIESVFDFLNYVIGEGHTLTSAFIIENGKPRSVPVDAFDGVSVLSAFRQLELEWNTVLAEPPRLSLYQDPARIRWCREQLAIYEQRIVELELMITDMNRLYQRAKITLRPSREKSGNPYKGVLERYKSQLSVTHMLRKGLLELI